MKIHYDDPREGIACGAVYDWREVGTGVTDIPRYCTCPECKSTPMVLAQGNEIVEIRMPRYQCRQLVGELESVTHRLGDEGEEKAPWFVAIEELLRLIQGSMKS